MSSKEACKYSEWVCPSCFVMPGDCESDLGSSSLQDQIKTEVLRVLPVVVTTVVVKQTEVFAARTYASVTKESQKEFVVHKCIEQSSSMAVEKGFQRIEDDIAQNDRRKRNIVIRNVPESIENTNTKQNKCDKGGVEKILNIKQPSDIIDVVRLGSQKDKGGNIKDYPRPLHVTLKTPDMAEYYHDYGMGYRMDEGNYWINPDLSKLEREANFRARQQRCELKKNRGESGIELTWQKISAIQGNSDKIVSESGPEGRRQNMKLLFAKLVAE